MEGMMKAGTFTGKTILITGGGTGLGKSMAKYLVSLGANVVIASRKLDVLEKTAAELKGSKEGKILPLSADVRNYDAIVQLIQSAESEFGQIHGVINNAAGNFISPTERLSHRAFDTIVDIVLKGTYYMCLAVGKNWIEKKQAGTFLNIVTTYAWTGSGYVVPSACGKAGVLALTRSLAVEWAKYNIRSNAIAPGPFPTEGAWSRLLPGELAKQFDPAQRIPLKRVGDHQELANLAAFLLSDYAGYINGEVITIDGGEWLRNGGQFSHLEQIPSSLWDQFERMRGKG